MYKKVVHNQTGEDTWLFRSFCIAGEDTDGKNLVRNFRELPAGPHYFDNILDIIYDVKSDKPQLDLQHIIVENVSRLPDSFLEEHWPSGFTKQDLNGLNAEQKIQYYKKLGQALVEDSKTYRSLNYRIKDAVDLAVKRVQWNFKTAIPVYFPTRNQMSLLLPLSLIDDETVDIALVVERTASGSYLGHTIISLEWAYKCARLVARPDSDWLSAERISDEQEAIDDILDVLE